MSGEPIFYVSHFEPNIVISFVFFILLIMRMINNLDEELSLWSLFPYVTPSMPGNSFCDSTFPFPSVVPLLRGVWDVSWICSQDCVGFQRKHAGILDILFKKNWRLPPPCASPDFIPGVGSLTSHGHGQMQNLYQFPITPTVRRLIEWLGGPRWYQIMNVQVLNAPAIQSAHVLYLQVPVQTVLLHLF